MKTKTMWIIALACAIPGALLMLMNDGRVDTIGLIVYGVGALLTLPFFLAINITAQRKRVKSGAASSDSVEYSAAKNARSALL
ncbi:MAG: hypothetical protein SPI25_02735 [Dialister sp.]|nr:hypothetical protein [Dialister sp.]